MTVEDFYPIDGTLRDVLLILEIIIVVCSFELSIYFIRRYFRAKNNPEEKTADIAWSILFFGWGLMWLLYYFADYRVSTIIQRQILLSVAGLVMASTAWILVVHIERHLFENRHPFTISFGILLALLVIVSIVHIQFAQMWTPVFFIPFVLMFVLYILRLRREYHLGGKVFVSLALGFWGLIVGFGGTTDAILEMTGGFQFRVAADAIQIGSFAFIAYFFVKVPTFAELEWRSAVRRIIAFEIESGLAVFAYDFDKTNDFEESGVPLGDQDILFASAMKAMTEFLRTIRGDPQKKPPSLFQQEDSTILIEYGDNIVAVAVSDKKLVVLRQKLQIFLRRVEKLLGFMGPQALQIGNFSVPIREIFNRVFLSKK